MRILLPVAIACGALGMVFGGMEVVVVAFAKASGVLKYTGFYPDVFYRKGLLLRLLLEYARRA